MSVFAHSLEAPDAITVFPEEQSKVLTTSTIRQESLDIFARNGYEAEENQVKMLLKQNETGKKEPSGTVDGKKKSNHSSCTKRKYF